MEEHGYPSGARGECSNTGTQASSPGRQIQSAPIAELGWPSVFPDQVDQNLGTPTRAAESSIDDLTSWLTPGHGLYRPDGVGVHFPYFDVQHLLPRGPSRFDVRGYVCV